MIYIRYNIASLNLETGVLKSQILFLRLDSKVE